jgi:hypothetical protein
MGMDIHEMLRPKALMYLPKESLLMFTVVRNTFERIVSCYQDKVKKTAEQKRKTIYDMFFYKFIFFIFSGKIYKGVNTTFEEFVYMISAVPDWIADRHFRSQSKMLQGNGKPVDNIIFLKLEDINSEWKQVGKLINTNLVVSQNSNNYSKKWQDFYSNTVIINIVNKRYISDVNLFGYESSYKDLIRMKL